MMSSDARAGDAQPWTIACLNLPLTWVDELMEAVVRYCAVAHRWIVFSEDMRRLGALTTHWAAEANLVVVMLPEQGRHVQEAAVAAARLGHEQAVDEAAAPTLRLLSVAPASSPPPRGVSVGFSCTASK